MSEDAWKHQSLEAGLRMMLGAISPMCDAAARHDEVARKGLDVTNAQNSSDSPLSLRRNEGNEKVS